MTLDEVLKALALTPDKDRAFVEKAALEATKDRLWVPNPGPQTDAYFSQADELFYGGQAGGGKTDLEIGLALNEHKRSLILRRTNKEADGLIERMSEVLGTRDGWNGQTGTWRIGSKTIDIGGCQLEDDKQKRKGIPHSLICYDEISDFSESQYTFINAWNRSADANERCRIVAAGNPPTRPEGMWVLKRWGAWLDPSHANPAKPGELRWYTTAQDGTEIEVDGKGPHNIGGEAVTARSRTFISARLSDNPDLASTDYSATLAGLPPELRAAYRDGVFTTGMEDDAYQALPSAWVSLAQQRWTPTPPVGAPMCAIGVDVAQGGKDKTVLAIRHDAWYNNLVVVPGSETPDGKKVTGLVVSHRRGGAKVIIDIGGGWGGDAFAHMRENGIDASSYMGVKKSVRRTLDGLLKFTNVRTEAYWRFREALDPSQAGGSQIALPRDNLLVADLCAPRYRLTTSGLALESKEDVCARLGRSTDRGDAVIMAWHDGIKQANALGGWNITSKRPTQCVMGRGKR